MSTIHSLRFDGKLHDNVCSLENLLKVTMEEAQRKELSSSCELNLQMCLVAMWLELHGGVRLCCK